MQGRSVAYAEIDLSTVMQPHMANRAGNVHGGEILKFMDIVAGTVGGRHSGGRVVTARVEGIDFLQPLNISDMVSAHGKVIFTGRCSMVILVTLGTVNIYEPNQTKNIARGIFTIVAVNESGRPRETAPLLLTNDEENFLFNEGKAIYEANMRRKHA